jgi:hypothetical protein
VFEGVDFGFEHSDLPPLRIGAATKLVERFDRPPKRLLH